MHPNRNRLTDNVALGHLPPHAAVAAIVAIVAHHKIMARFHNDGKVTRPSAVVCLHQVTIRSGQNLATHLYRVPPGRQFCQPFLRDRLPVHGELFISVFDLISGHTDHPLDVVGVVLVGREKHHHVSALWRPHIQDFGPRYRQTQTIRKLVYQNVVTDLQRRHHG